VVPEISSRTDRQTYTPHNTSQLLPWAKCRIAYPVATKSNVLHMQQYKWKICTSTCPAIWKNDPEIGVTVLHKKIIVFFS